MEQSASLPGSTPPSSPLFLRARSRAFRAATRALAACNDFSINARADLGFSSRKAERCSFTATSTAPRTSELPSFVLVCPSNCGSMTFTLRTQVNPSRTSSPDRLSSFLKILLRRA